MKKIFISLLILVSAFLGGCSFLWIKNLGQKNIEIVVLAHHNLTGKNIDIFYEQLQKEFSSFERIIILSPDHFGVLKSSVEGLPKDQKMLCYNESCVALTSFGKYDTLLKSGISKNGRDTIEHGIGEHITRIAKFFPDTKVTPILLMRKLAITKMDEKLAHEIVSLPEKKILVVASVDFSHHVLEEFAKYHDEVAVNVLKNGDMEDFSRLEVDCRNCLAIAQMIAHKVGKNNFSLIMRTSVDTISGGNSELGNTSHIFGKFITSDENSMKEEIIFLLPNFAIRKDYEKIIEKFYNFYDKNKNPRKFYHRISVGFDRVFIVGEKIFREPEQEIEMKNLGLSNFISYEELKSQFAVHNNVLDFSEKNELPLLVCKKSIKKHYCKKLQLNF